MLHGQLVKDEHSFPPVRGRYAPVIGGRWSVRRWEDWRSGRDGKVWHAWSRGTAKIYSQRFRRHAEAVAWAQQVAKAFKTRDGATLQMLGQYMHPS